MRYARRILEDSDTVTNYEIENENVMQLEHTIFRLVQTEKHFFFK